MTSSQEDLATWTNVGMVAQGSEVYAGSFAARATTTSAASWAWHTFANQTNAYYRIRFKIVSLGPNNVYLLKVRTSTGTSIGGLYVDTANTLNYRNDAGALTVRSPRSVSLGAWHELQVHYVINGLAGQIETWLDGAKVPELSKTDNFGTTAVGRIQIADNSGARAYDVAIDDVVVDTQFISSGPASDTTAPSAPGSLTASAVDSSRIERRLDRLARQRRRRRLRHLSKHRPLDSVVGELDELRDTTVDPGSSYTYAVGEGRRGQ